MSSQFGSQTFHQGDRTRASGGNSSRRVLVAALVGCAGLFASNAMAGGTRVAVSAGFASGGTYVGGSYSNGFYGGGRGYCPPARYCGPVGYCPPVRPYCGPSYYGGWGYRPYRAAVWGAPCAPAYLPPVYVAPSGYACNQPSVSFGIGVAGSNGAGYFSYSSAPSVSTFYSTPTYVPAPVVYSAPAPVVYTTPAPVVYTSQTPSVTVITNSSQPQQPVAQAPAPQEQAPVINTPPPAPPRTVYQSSGASGTMDKATTPSAMISVIRAESGDARSQAAEFYLGKTPPQSWSVTFEGVQESGGVKEVRCRAAEPLSSGYYPTIIVRGAGDSNNPPRQSRGKVTGRVASITIDDPAYPGGLIVLDDGWLKW